MRQIFAAYPQFTFMPGSRFMWSPQDANIHFDSDTDESNDAKLTLIHEIGHGLLSHKDYSSDIQLLNMEVDAWEQARIIAPKFGVEINEHYIDSCLETYRVWLYKRSRCPACEHHGVQKSAATYHCFMCRTRWRVAQTHTLHPKRMRPIKS